MSSVSVVTNSLLLRPGLNKKLGASSPPPVPSPPTTSSSPPTPSPSTTSPSSSPSSLPHLWYSCYGSNLSYQRFSCYIQGGTPAGTGRHHPGCSNGSPPLRDRPHIVHHQLYFAEHSPTWENGGVAFLHPVPQPTAHTYGRIYLITTEQFLQVLRQENSLDPDDPTCTVDLETTIRQGSSRLPRGWYSLVLFLGYEEGIPVFTFTSPEILPANPPGPRYLATIRSGLREMYPSLGDNAIDDYLGSRSSPPSMMID